ncbi:hypothetical protein M0R72_20515 [Candidatus Pacearchaeota archaeon]|jgi:hypothetical protein|nr:hypothetical protein [Candidatus Pacearchaeota archaeon]
MTTDAVRNDSSRDARHKDYGCLRNLEVKKWMKSKESLCWIDKDMEYHAEVEAFSMVLSAKYNVNLNYVSSDAIKPYMLLREKTDEQKAFKNRVLEMVISVIKTDKNPFTGISFGYYGITEYVMARIIQYCATGSYIPEKVERTVVYTKEDVNLLSEVFGRMRSMATADDMRRLDLLYGKLVNRRVRLLFAGKM